MTLPVGAQPFAELCPQTVLKGLRSQLKDLGVVDADKYRPHRFRSGHANGRICRGQIEAFCLREQPVQTYDFETSRFDLLSILSPCPGVKIVYVIREHERSDLPARVAHRLRQMESVG